MNKLEDRGFEAVWIGYGLNHPNNTFRFMNLRNKEIIHSHDYTWLNVTLNEFRNEKRMGNGVLKLRFLEDNDQRMTRNMTRVIGDKNGDLHEKSDDIIEIEEHVHDVDNINEASEVIPIESDDENLDPMNNVETSLLENEEVNFG